MKRMRISGLSVLCLLCLAMTLLSAGCVNTAETPEYSFRLNGTSWEVANSQFPTTITFENALTASGFGGANFYTTAYFESNDYLKFEEIIATENIGPNLVMTAEENYFKALKSVVLFQLRENDLMMMDIEGNAVLRFEKVGKYTDLSETEWILTNFPTLNILLPSDSEISLRFGQDGLFTGFTEINSYSGRYSAVDSNLLLGSISSTEKAGSIDAMNRENTYYQLFSSVKKYSLENESLTLNDDENQPLLIFRKKTGEENLIGKTWNVYLYLKGDVPTYSNENNVTLIFLEDGSYQGNFNLREYSGNYQVAGKMLAMTKPVMPNDEETMQETKYSEALEKVSSYKITSAGTFAVYDSFGNLLMLFDWN